MTQPQTTTHKKGNSNSKKHKTNHEVPCAQQLPTTHTPRIHTISERWDTKVPRSYISHATRPALPSVIFAALGTYFCCGRSYLRFQRSSSWLAWAYHPPPWPPLLPPGTWTRIPDEAAEMVEEVRSSAPAFDVGRDTCRR